MLRDAWDRHAAEWVAWARAPDHDSYWRFHREAFLARVPAPGRLTVDVGCGEGRVGRDLARLGHRVVGFDASVHMARAAASHPRAAAPVAVADAAALPVAGGAADCVVAFMSLHDIDGLEGAVGEAARLLRTGGHLVVAIPHPVNTAGAFRPSAGEEHAAAQFIIDGSYLARRRTSDTEERGGLSMTFHSEHRPLQVYADALADAGFVIERVGEVTDPDPARGWRRIPMFLHLVARLDRTRTPPVHGVTV